MELEIIMHSTLHKHAHPGSWLISSSLHFLLCQSEVAAGVCADLQLVPDQVGDGEREGPGPESQHSKACGSK